MPSQQLHMHLWPLGLVEPAEGCICSWGWMRNISDMHSNCCAAFRLHRLLCQLETHWFTAGKKPKQQARTASKPEILPRTENMGEEFNYSLDLIWPAKTRSCSRSLTLERAAFRRRIPGRLFSDMNSPPPKKKEWEEKIKRASVIKTFCDFPKRNILKPLFILDWNPPKWLIPDRKSFF